MRVRYGSTLIRSTCLLSCAAGPSEFCEANISSHSFTCLAKSDNKSCCSVSLADLSSKDLVVDSEDFSRAFQRASTLASLSDMASLSVSTEAKSSCKNDKQFAISKEMRSTVIC